jgi:hypothetical protein
MDVLTISLKDVHNDEVLVTVFDIPGRLLFTDNYHMNGNGSFQINLGFLPNGLYLLRIESQDMTITRKIIRQ